MKSTITTIDCKKFTNQLLALACRCKSNPYQYLDNFLLECHSIVQELPDELIHAIKHFSYKTNGGCLLLKSLPSDSKISSFKYQEKYQLNSKSPRFFYSEIFLGIIGQNLGDVVGVEKRDIFQDVCPCPGHEMEFSAKSSQVALQLHTEKMFHPYTPDFLLLSCIRPDRERKAETTIVNAENIYQSISKKHQDLLSSKIFYPKLDLPHIEQSMLYSVFYEYQNRLSIRFNVDFLTSPNSYANESLHQLNITANTICESVYLDKGDLLIIDNRRCLHGRSRFVATYDGFDRWLQRIHVIENLSSVPTKYKRDRVINYKKDKI
jgi:hypothetical protein